MTTSERNEKNEGTKKIIIKNRKEGRNEEKLKEEKEEAYEESQRNLLC